jgi:hypothetical protein
MKRIDFLKKLGIGLGVAVIAPSVVANNATSEEKPTGWYSRTFPSFRDPRTGHNVYVDNGHSHYSFEILDTPTLVSNELWYYDHQNKIMDRIL